MTDQQNDGIAEYFEAAASQLARVLEMQRPAMEAVAQLWTDVILNDKLIYSFGSGHSRFIAGELYWRAGGLAPVMMIEDPTKGSAERLEGYAGLFMQEYAITAGDVIVVISNSGINPVPIEVALFARDKGAKVVSLTGLEHSQQATSRHSSGKKLYEISDIVLDTMGVYGDAVVPVPGYDWKVSPTSTLVSVAILNAIVAQTARNLLALGHMPPVLISANVKEGDDHNRHMSEKYWQRLTHFPRRRP